MFFYWWDSLYDDIVYGNTDAKKADVSISANLDVTESIDKLVFYINS